MPKIGTILKSALVLAVIGGLVYWFRFQPVPVQSLPVSRGTVIQEVMGTGTLEARVTTTISPEIAGRIQQVLVDQGDVVEPGQLLVQLDDRDLKQQVAIAEADVEAKQAAIVRLQADIERATAVRQQANTNLQRLNSLIQEGAISREELDKATESQLIAESEWARAKAGLAEGQKTLAVSQKTLEFQQTQLNDARIVAPFAGLIVRRDRDPGDIAVPGSAIMQLISTQEIWINAWIDETAMAFLKTGQPASIIFRSQPDQVFSGELVRLGNETDRETREFLVDVKALKLPENWAVGQRAEVYIHVQQKTDVISIPGQYLQRRDDQNGVFLLQDGWAKWQPVTVGIRGRDHVEILEGLELDQTLILPIRGRTLQSGQPVVTP